MLRKIKLEYIRIHVIIVRSAGMRGMFKPIHGCFEKYRNCPSPLPRANFKL